MPTMHRPRYLAIGLVALLCDLCCLQTEGAPPEATNSATADSSEGASDEEFFTSGTFGDAKESIGFRHDLSADLATMHETSLTSWETRPGNAGGEIYRFLWVRSYDHPVVVRLE